MASSGKFTNLPYPEHNLQQFTGIYVPPCSCFSWGSFPSYISLMEFALLHRSTQYQIAVRAVQSLGALFSHQVHMAIILITDSTHLFYFLYTRYSALSSPFSLPYPSLPVPCFPSRYTELVCSLWLTYVWISHCDLSCIYFTVYPLSDSIDKGPGGPKRLLQKSLLHFTGYEFWMFEKWIICTSAFSKSKKLWSDDSFSYIECRVLYTNIV